MKLYVTGHHGVVSLVNYNFALRYKSGKVYVDTDALSQIPLEDHDQHIEADIVQALISSGTQSNTLIEVYSCNIHVTETLNMQKDPKAMSQKIGYSPESRYCDMEN